MGGVDQIQRECHTMDVQTRRASKESTQLAHESEVLTCLEGAPAKGEGINPAWGRRLNSKSNIRHLLGESA